MMGKRFLIGAGVFLLVLVLLVGSFSAGFLTSRYLQKLTAKKYTTKTSLELLKEAMVLIRHSYVKPVSLKKLVQGAIRGMVKSLGDPYSQYLTPSEYKMFKEHTMGHFYGVGIELGKRDGDLVVITPLKGTPAERAGIKPNDKIVAIDGKSTKGMALEKAVRLIRGKEGTKVTLTIKREGEEKLLNFELIREKISFFEVVQPKILDKDIGYIYLHTFDEDSAENVRKAVDDLKKKGAKGIILDLRNNPGGLLDESVGVASVFIEDGPIVKIKRRSGRTRTFYAEGGADEKIPLVVLVNESSASASEIVAGAVKDTGRGVIVGEKTFGKGSVQEMIELSDGSGIVLTTDIYLTPKGISIHKKGIRPDVVVPMKDIKPLSKKDVQLKKAKEILRDMISGKGFKKAA